MKILRIFKNVLNKAIVLVPNNVHFYFIEIIMLERKLQIEICQIRKVIQLHETMIVRWGVMLVGPTGGGKTVVLHVSLKSLKAIYR